jgi:hypothetical protein
MFEWRLLQCKLELASQIVPSLREYIVISNYFFLQILFALDWLTSVINQHGTSIIFPYSSSIRRPVLSEVNDNWPTENEQRQKERCSRAAKSLISEMLSGAGLHSAVERKRKEKCNKDVPG